MTGKALWQKLKTLVDCDKQILETKEKIFSHHKELEKRQKIISKLETCEQEKEKLCIQGKKNVHMQELQAKDLQKKEEDKRQQLLKISNQKEYKAFEKEIKELVHKQAMQEDVLVQAWNQLELTTKDFEKTVEENKIKIKQLKSDIEEQEKTTTILQKKLEEYLQVRQKAAVDIPAEWLSRYERMKNNVPDPIVPVIQNSCSACFYSILKQDLYKLKRSGVLPCRNCYRFLYYNEEEEKDAKRATF